MCLFPRYYRTDVSYGFMNICLNNIGKNVPLAGNAISYFEGVCLFVGRDITMVISYLANDK